MTFIFICCICLFYIVAHQILLGFWLLVEKNKHCNNVILGFDELWLSLFLNKLSIYKKNKKITDTALNGVILYFMTVSIEMNFVIHL